MRVFRNTLRQSLPWNAIFFVSFTGNLFFVLFHSWRYWLHYLIINCCSGVSFFLVSCLFVFSLFFPKEISCPRLLCLWVNVLFFFVYSGDGWNWLYSSTCFSALELFCSILIIISVTSLRIWIAAHCNQKCHTLIFFRVLLCMYVCWRVIVFSFRVLIAALLSITTIRSSY